MPNPYPTGRLFPSVLRVRWWLVVWVALPGLAQAQNGPAVRGSVTTAAGAPVEYATVTLHRAADSTVVKTEFSDGRGAFQFDTAPPDGLLVSVAQVGFVRYWTGKFTASGSGTVLPAIVLRANPTTALQEVTVTARKPLYEHLNDRTVVNVADSPLSAGSTALDILSRAPGVTVHGTDVIELRGRGGILVLIDGKRTPLAGVDLADYLRSLPAEQLQSIDLITRPSAQYDAQGNAGIIAVNLKKDQRQGTNGNLNASYGQGVYGKFTGGFGLNHRHKKLNAYGTYAYTDRTNFVRLDFDRTYAATAQQAAATSKLYTQQISKLRSHTAKAGLDLNLTKRTLLGVSGNALLSQTDLRTDNNTRLLGPLGDPTSRYTSLANQDLRRPSGSANLNVRHVFADSATARSLSADADLARYTTTRLSDLTTDYVEPTAAQNLLVGDQESNLTIATLKADFRQPLPGRARLEAGAKVTRVVSDNDVQFMGIRNGVRMPLPSVSSVFHYFENVRAAYVNYNGKLRRTTVQAGLRAEQTRIEAATEGEPLRKQNYTQLFPSVLLQRALNDRHALSLSIDRRIDRPSYQQVNPLRNYFDATSYRSGNPDLVAQTSYNVELTHTFKQKYITGLLYTHTNLPIVNVVQPAPDGGLLVVNRDVNLSRQNYYGLTLTLPVDLAKWCSVSATGVAFYNYFAGTVAGTVLERGQAAYTLNGNASFILPHGWAADLNGQYQSPEKYGFETITQRGQVTAGVQKSLWNKQATLRFNMADIFYSLPVRSTSTFQNFSESFYRRQDTRVATVALTYRFGNGKVPAARKRAAGAEEELRRAAGQ